jgi:dynein heavy chain, axonemal
MEEAHDNVSALSTLERHFKTIASGPLDAIGDALPGLMSALRLVWVLSRHYKDDGRMGSLLKRIAVQIGDRVEEVIKPQVVIPLGTKMK